MKHAEILARLRSLSDPKALEGMARFGIRPKNAYGISIPALRKLAKEIGRDHALAQKLWAFSVHEARILAAMIDEPELVSRKQMEKWARAFDAWDVCDQVCMNLFRYTQHAYSQCRAWSSRREEFVKRAGFALMACLAAGDKDGTDEEYLKFLPLIKKESVDGRNYVKKAVNWALRQIGKRNVTLHAAAIKTAKEIRKIGSASARWIASDALRELSRAAVQNRLKRSKAAGRSTSSGAGMA